MEITKITGSFSGSARELVFLVNPAREKLKLKCLNGSRRAVLCLPGVRGGRSVKEVNILFSLSNGCRALLPVEAPLGYVLPSNALWSSLEEACEWWLTIPALSINYVCNYIWCRIMLYSHDICWGQLYKHTTIHLYLYIATVWTRMTVHWTWINWAFVHCSILLFFG